MVSPDPYARPERQPIFNLPASVTLLLVLLGGIHLLRVYVLPVEAEIRLIVDLAFIPARFGGGEEVGIPPLPLGGFWTFATYALLHGSGSHILVNSVWLAAFGSPLAWRFGMWRFLLFSILGAVGGAVLHLATHPGDPVPMVGASAAISAHMAAACRFAFGGILGGGGGTGRGGAAFRRPAMSLGAALSDRRVIGFLAAWFGINLVFGLMSSGGGVLPGAIAWQAHIGGFLVGLFGFALFDPVPRHAVAPPARE